MNTTEKERSTYSNKLYSICDFMFANPDSFKNYAIYDDKLAFHSVNSISQEDKSALHNCLKNNYNFLTGQSDKPLKPSDPKGANVMPSLNLEKLSKENTAKILALFYESTFENRKSTYSLFNVNIEKSNSLLNRLIKHINQNYITPDFVTNIENLVIERELQSDNKKMSESDYFLALRDLYDISRIELRKYQNDAIGKIIKYDDLRISIEFFYQLLFNPKSVPTQLKSKLGESKIAELEHNFATFQDAYPQFGNLRSIYFTWLYCDLFCLCLLQFIINRIRRQITSIYDIKQLNSFILSLIDK